MNVGTRCTMIKTVKTSAINASVRVATMTEIFLKHPLIGRKKFHLVRKPYNIEILAKSFNSISMENNYPPIQKRLFRLFTIFIIKTGRYLVIEE